MDSTEPDIVNAQTKDAQEYEMKRTGSNHLGTFARYLNTYSLMATESVYKNQRRETDRKRVYILTRSTFAGQQRAAATTWSGDIGASWEVYRNQIPAGLNHSMSGIPYWTFDIGAFVLGSYGGVFAYGGKDPAYQELYTRMFQFGAFCPIFRSHGSDTPREIWEFGKFSDVLVAFDRLRYRLMPYIYSNAWKITNEGYTIMRGLPMDFPGDGNTYNIQDQFMFGPALMVCPVTEYMLHRPPGKSMLVSGEHFRTKDGKPGLDATYFGDDHFGTAVHSQTESNVDLYWYTGWPSFVKSEKFSMRWEGRLVPTETGPHRFHVKCFGPKLLLLDGQPLKFVYTSVEAMTEPVQLEAGREYSFSYATSNSVLGAFRAQLFWKTPLMLAAETVREERPQTRSVYLPAGATWFDFWTGQTTAGGQSIHAVVLFEHAKQTETWAIPRGQGVPGRNAPSPRQRSRSCPGPLRATADGTPARPPTLVGNTPHEGINHSDGRFGLLGIGVGPRRSAHTPSAGRTTGRRELATDSRHHLRQARMRHVGLLLVGVVSSGS